MRSTRLFYFALLVLFLITFSTTSIIARAADDETDEAEEYDVKARVVRISLISGGVTLKRKDNTEWEAARLNTPLVEGDAVSTGSSGDARVEIQIDARNFVRLGPNSILRIVTLRDEGVALSLVEGTASVRLAKFAADKESFEIDAPKTTLAVEKTGLYRIDVGKDGRVRLTARDGGRARIYSESSGFALRDGRAADLIIDGPDAGEWEMLMAARDPWDDWLDERERDLAQRLRYNTQYYDDDVWGAEDLDAYGAWTNTKDYGWIWRPHATVISSYDNWAPYRYGQWTWVDPYGWTWIGNEPWGWAPYHFGRWVYYNNYWAWVPRSQYHRKRSWWRPALVAFVINISVGDQICWYPLSYHHRDPRSRNYHRGDRDDRRDRPRHDDRDDRRRRPGHWGGVTGIPSRDFGGRNARPRPVNERDGRRVVSADPLPNVPVRPNREINRPGANGDRPERRAWTRRDGSVPGPAFPERRTGAAERSPGLPLDRELRRSRVWNGREARRQESPVTTGRTGAVDTRPTGVVERPTRTLREGDRDVTPRREGDRGARGDRDVNRSPDRDDRDDRVGRPNRASVPRSPESNEPRVPAPDTPVRTPANEERAPVERPARAQPYYRPAPVDREERPERGERNEESPRQTPAERRTESSSPSERSPQHERPTHAEPAPRSDSTPRSEPLPQRSEPQRSEPPAPNDPPPPPVERSEPPQRNDPPPTPVERSEPPPRNDPPPTPVERSEPPPRNDPPPSPPPVERFEPPPRNDPPPSPPPVERSEPPPPIESLALSVGRRVRARRVPFIKNVFAG